MIDITHIIKHIYVFKHFIQTKFIPINFIKNESPKSLGRWNINYCNKTMSNKVDLANEDHCGPCGQYAITKKDKL